MKKLNCLILFLSSFSIVHAQLPSPVIQTGNSNTIKVITASRDGLLYATGGADNKVVLWDAKSHGQIVQFKTDSEEMNDTIINGQMMNYIGFKAGIENDNVFVADGSGRQISAIAIDSSDRLIAFGNKEGKIFLWDIISKTMLEKISMPDFESKQNLISKLFFSNDGRYLVVQGKDFRIYDIGNKDWVYNNPDIVAFDFSFEEQMLYVVKKNQGKLQVLVCQITDSIPLKLDFTGIDSVLLKVLSIKGKLIKKFSPEKLQFIVHNRERMAFLYENSIRWKHGKKYFFRSSGEFDEQSTPSSICFVDSEFIAFGIKNLFVFNTSTGRNRSAVIADFEGTNNLYYDPRNKILLSATGANLQAIDLRTGRMETFGSGKYFNTHLQVGNNSMLYIGNGFGIRTFQTILFLYYHLIYLVVIDIIKPGMAIGWF